MGNRVEKNNNLFKTDFQWQYNGWVYNAGNASTEKTDKAKKDSLVYKTTLLTNEQKLVLPKDLLEAGNYKIEVVCKENGKIIGQTNKEFGVFDLQLQTWGNSKVDFQYLPIKVATNGDTIMWYMGTKEPDSYVIYHAQYFSKTKRGEKVSYNYDFMETKPGINVWKYVVPDNVVSRIELTQLYIKNNSLHRETATINVTQSSAAEPEIIIEKYRKKAAPGGKETYVVSIKTKNENTAAELLTTMYDASLDKLEKHNWEPFKDKRNFYLQNEWNTAINKMNRSSVDYYSPQGNTSKTYKVQSLLWWMNPSVQYNQELNNDYDIFSPQPMHMKLPKDLTGSVSGLLVNGSANLSEVVVIGYGVQKQTRTTASTTILSRKISSIDSYKIPLVILDGVIYEGDMSKINTSLITAGIILKGADAVALYGAKASNGVIVLSTKGEIQLPVPQEEEKPVVVRKNFSETAFFFPQVHADKDGFYSLTFTMPESVTEWNWKMLAHTKDAKFAYAQRTITTQLPLMVQPNMPRFL